jgi:hypothetical protein
MFSRAQFSIGIFIAIALHAVTASAQPDSTSAATDAYRSLTAKELLSGIDEGSLAEPGTDPARQTELSTGRATAYIFGVADTTAGKAWCSPRKLTITELASTTYDYLAKLPASRLSDPAAGAITQALKAAYPCK